MSKKKNNPEKISMLQSIDLLQSTDRQGSAAKYMVLVPVLCMLLFTLFVFGGPIISPTDTIISMAGCDLTSEYVHRRFFGFEEMKKGNLALWNPHIQIGMPFFGALQSALLYPPNLLYLVLPLAKAINIGIALHVFLGGLFMYLWIFRRGIHPLAALFSSLLFMFSGVYFLHIYAGHLSNLCTMVWVPLLFLALDEFLKQRKFIWCVVGIFSVSMQILGGHPQYVFYSGVAAVLYFIFMVWRAEKKLQACAGFTVIFAGAVLLTAAQLLPGIEAGLESARSKNVSLEFAAKYSFPPENLLTLITPHFFGVEADQTYWGRHNIWEVSLFVGVSALILAIIGSIYGDKKLRRFSLILTGILILLSFGGYTPLLTLLYHVVPGFNKFRGNSKFIFQATLFILMLAAIGFDYIIKSKTVTRRVIQYLFGCAGCAVLVGIIIRISASGASSSGLWQQYMESIYRSGEVWGIIMRKPYFREMSFLVERGITASNEMFVLALKLLVIAGIFHALVRYKQFANRILYGLAAFGILEILAFMVPYYKTFELSMLYNPAAKPYYDESKTDAIRVLHTRTPNYAMLFGGYDIGGNDPAALRRYLQFVSYTQNQNPDTAIFCNFSRYLPLYKMFRLKYALIQNNDQFGVQKFDEVMPRLNLIQEYAVIKNRDMIFQAMINPRIPEYLKTNKVEGTNTGFDPARYVILESEPYPKPVKIDAAAPGTVKLLSATTDKLEIEADLHTPSILLVTDGYSQSWKVSPLPGSAQTRYQVMPANYVLRAVPLSAGHHRFVMEYKPETIIPGFIISLITLAVLVGYLGYYYKCGRRAAGVLIA